MQEDAKGIFEMELENAAEFADENEKCDDMVWSNLKLFVVHFAFFLSNDIIKLIKMVSIELEIEFI